MRTNEIIGLCTDVGEVVPVSTGGFSPGLLLSDAQDHSSGPEGPMDQGQLPLQGQGDPAWLDGLCRPCVVFLLLPGRYSSLMRKNPLYLVPLVPLVTLV